MQKTVYFRTFEEEDVDLIYKWMNDDELKKLSVGLNRRMSKEECKNWINARKDHNPYQVWWAICAIDTDKMIGYACITNIHYINSSAEYGGIVIGDVDYKDGTAWIETYLHVFDYVFENFNLHRLYGYQIVEHKSSVAMARAMFFSCEGILKESIFKGGKYHDAETVAILANEYFAHKEIGDYEYESVLKRLLKNLKKK